MLLQHCLIVRHGAVGQRCDNTKMIYELTWCSKKVKRLIVIWVDKCISQMMTPHTKTEGEGQNTLSNSATRGQQYIKGMRPYYPLLTSNLLAPVAK